MSVNAAICLLMLFAFGSAAATGYKKGLFALAIPIVTFILAIILSKSGFLSNIPDFDIGINTNKLTEQIISNVQENSQGETLFDILLPEDAPLNSFSNMMKGLYSNNLVNVNIPQTVKFLILYSIISAVLNILFRSFSKKVVVNSLNRILGATFNVTWCFVRFWIFICFIYVLSIFIPPIQEIHNTLMTSNLYKYMFEVNPIL